MDARATLKLNNDFRRMYSRAKRVSGGYVTVYAMKNRRDYNRLGLTVGKHIAKACGRNRIKRLMRESVRLMNPRIASGFDIVIVAKPKAVGKTYAQISTDIRYCLKKLKLYEDAPEDTGVQKAGSDEKNIVAID